MGADPAASSTPALHRSGRRSLARRRAVGGVPARVLLAGAGAVAALPRPVRGTAGGGIRSRRTPFLRHACFLGGTGRLRRAPPGHAAHRLGGLCQAAVRWACAGAGLSRPLHPPRRHRPARPAHPGSPTAMSFSWKDYRHDGKTKPMTLSADEFIRRFLLHTVPDGFHRIRHLGFLANGHRTAKLALCRALAHGPHHRTRRRAKVCVSATSS